MMKPSDNVPHYSVGQISNYIKEIFARDFLLRNLCVEGEVSNLKYHPSGHIYFTLKDSEAQINAVMFARYRESGLNFELQNGQKIVVRGTVTVYEKGGQYQLLAARIEKFGTGYLYEKFLATKNKLEEMGLFSPIYKKPIPAYALRIGIVTASSGAALQDILNISHRRNPYVQMILCPAQVQGEGAAKTIVSAIEKLDRLKPDVIIVGRGGGSIEDLWAFNEESVAEAIFNADTPIISAVGHETDITIADLAADLRAPTPSAAAELAVFDYAQFMNDCRRRKERLTHAVLSRISSEKSRVTEITGRLKKFDPRLSLRESQFRLKDSRDRMKSAVDKHIRDLKLLISEDEKDLKDLMKDAALKNRQRLQLYSARLEGCSPLAKLAGGYAFAEKADATPLSSVRELSRDDLIRVHLKDGRILASVKEITENE